MPTATIQWDAWNGSPGDGSAGNAGPALLSLVGSESNPKKLIQYAAFDPATDEHLWFQFRMPADYASGGDVKLLWMTNDASAGEECVWGARLGAITPADADTPVEHPAAAATTVATGVDTNEPRRLIETAITLANLDTVAAGDLCYLLVYRDADNASDDLTSDAELISVAVEYVTS